MIITCPNCEARYEVDRRTFPARGRAVRCARCKEIWQAVATEESELEILPPERDAEAASPPRPESKETAYEPGSGAQLVDDGPAAAEDGDEHGTETEAPARARRAARRARGRQAGTSQRMQRGAQALVVGMAAALAVAAVVNREAVVRAVPSTAGLFRTLGMPVNLRGLDFDTVTLHRVFEDGLSVLIVNGQIVNLRDAEIPVPALRFALRGGTGEELYTWVVEPRQAMLEPRGTMSFRSRLAAPPHGAQDVEVRFVDRTRQSAGMQP